MSKKRPFLAIFAVLFLAIGFGADGASLESMMEPVAPPTAVEAFDTPNDAGGSITLTWPKDPRASEHTTYQIAIADSPSGPFRVAAEVSAVGSLMSAAPGLFGYGDELDNFHYVHIEEFAGAGEKTRLEDGKSYYFHIDVRSAGGTIRGTTIVEASAEGNLFNWAKLNNLVLGTIF